MKDKIKFETRELAEAELRRIVESNDYRNWKRVSPKRVYYENGYYYLTSKINVEIPNSN